MANILNLIESEIKNLIREINDTSYQIYKDILAELEPLDIKQVNAKLKEFKTEYEQTNRFDFEKRDVINMKISAAEQMLDKKKGEVNNNLYNKLIGLPFLGSTIEEIIFPEESYDGKFNTFYIKLADENDFEYKTGDFPEFRYYNENTGWHTQKINNPHINPSDALLTNKELQTLILIVKLDNSKYPKYKKPLPTNAVTKDSTTTYEPPTVQTQDLQWLIGQGDPNNKHEQISDVNVYNNTEKNEEYGGGFISLSVTVGDNIMFSKRYYYSVDFNAYFEPIKEKFEMTYGIGGKKQKVNGLYDYLYEPFIKAIKQINPKSKLVNKIYRYRT